MSQWRRQKWQAEHFEAKLRLKNLSEPFPCRPEICTKRCRRDSFFSWMSNKKKNLSTYSQIPPHHAPLRAITKESHSHGPRDCGPNSSRQMLCKGHRQSRWQNRHPVLPESQPMLGPSEEILPRLTAKLAKAS